MTHDPAMHGMIASTWVLMLVPLFFVALGVIWYRQSAKARQLEEEAAGPGSGENAGRS